MVHTVNKPLTLFSAIAESPKALAKFLRAVEIGKIKLDRCFCKSNCGDDDGCPHELQCIINWLNQPYARKPDMNTAKAASTKEIIAM